MIRGAVGETGIAYRIDGVPGGANLVFSNSLGTDHRLWDRQMPAVEDRYRVIRYEACGHGAADPPGARVTIDTLGQDLIALLDHLEVDRTVICGCSLGGLVALWLCVNHPDRVIAAVLANTGAKLGTDESWNARISAVRDGGTVAVRDLVIGRFLTPEFRERDAATTALIAGMIEATSAEGYIAACEALRDADLRVAARTVRVPAMIVGSERDESTPPAFARDLHAAIPGSELFIIPAAAHLSNVESPTLFNEALVRAFDMA